MAIEMRKLTVDELAKGMFVSRLDRPWIETPFPLQGFFIRELNDIDMLRRYCRHVFIDVQRSARTEPVIAVAAASSSKPVAAVAKARVPTYQTTVSVQQEATQGQHLHQEVSVAISSVFETIRKGQSTDLRETRQVVSGVVDSVIRNPDAMVWLARMRDKDSYSYAHAVRCSIWAVVFGRYLGLSKVALDALATGVLLMDVGKAKVPAEILQKKSALSPEERREIQRHVTHSLDILRNSPQMNDQIFAIVSQHHERYDGSGYPNALQGNAIAPMAKIAGVVDTYDAMTSPRAYAQALTSVEAVSRLYELRNKTFQARLVEEFIQAIGVYPTGTLVRLSSDEVGIVIEQNPMRRLRPRLMLLLDHKQQPLAHPQILDLNLVNHDFKGEPLKVVSSLLAGSYNLYPEQWQLNVA